VAVTLRRCEYFLKAARPAGLRATESLESELHQLFVSARAAWPSVDVPEDIYLRSLGARYCGDLRDLHAADLYLACACERQEPEAIRILERQFLCHLAADLATLKPTAELMAEVRQQLLTKFILGNGEKRPKISGYSGRGPLKSWVRAASLRTAINLQAKERREALTSDATLLETAVLGGNVEVDFLRRHYRSDLKAALTSALRQLSKRDRNVLRLHYLGGMSLNQLASVYRVHPVSVSRWLSASRAAIFDGARRSLAERLQLDSVEVKSLFRLMRNHVEVSIRRLLQSSRKH
jgi:RNA polymerase sigma-70 factor (ECF subfamily)